MNAIKILQKYYNPKSECYRILLAHSQAVSKKALAIAENLKEEVDLDFIKEASLLHDIGVFLTDAPEIDCHGEKPYICHGYLGREILEKEGFPKHALVCERHVGVGISIDDIKKQNIPLPMREMKPLTLEEEIISYADKFFSKSKSNLNKEKSIDQIKKELQKYGDDKIKIFDTWHNKFN